MNYRIFQLPGLRVITILATLLTFCFIIVSSAYLFSSLPAASAAKSRTAFVTIEVNPEGDSLTPDVFSPNEIVVMKKTTVTWTNNDPILRHTVTEGLSPAYQEPPEGYTPLFDSGILQPGGSFSFTFEKKGEYYYYCIIHPFVTGEVIVGKERGD